MTDTGRIPGEGQPENAGAPQEEPGPQDPVGYTYAPSTPASPAEPYPAHQAPRVQPSPDDLLLMPSPQGAWGDPAQPVAEPGQPHRQDPQAYAAPDQHYPDGHQADGRDSGVHDYGAVRTPPHGSPVHRYDPSAGRGEAAGEASAQQQPQASVGPDVDEAAMEVPAQAEPEAAPQPGPDLAWSPAAQSGAPTPRRPLHLGPPVPEQSGTVRSLSERGPSQPSSGVGARVAPEARTAPAVEAPEPSSEPEYLDAPQEQYVPPPTGDPAAEAALLPGPQLGALPPQPGDWSPPPVAADTTPGEEAVPEPGQSAAYPLTGPDLAAMPAPEPLDEEQPVVAEPAAEGVSAAPQQYGGEHGPVVAPDPGAPQATDPQPPADEPTAPDHATSEQATVEPPAVPQAAPPHPDEQVRADAPGVDGTPGAEDPVAPPADQREPQPGDAPPAAEESLPVVGEQAEPPSSSPAPAEPSQDGEDGQDTLPHPEGESEPAEGALQQAEVVAPEAEASAQTVPAPRSAEPAEQAQEPSETALPEAEATSVPPPAESEDVPVPEGQQEEQPQEASPPPPAPGYSDAEREAVHRAMRERRDVTQGFRPDPIPHEVLLRVLEAAHTAPSMGHSQPWDFVIIRSEETRRALHDVATHQREAYARTLPKGRAKQFRQLKVEAILDTPVNIVVTADPTRGGRHAVEGAGRSQTAPYSSALAVENLWLAARAEGLGVAWVSFFDEREVVRELGLPEHLEIVAYLCVGYVDAFPTEPELAQSGFSSRRPLSWVVHEEAYGRRVLPGAEAHDLLSETLAAIRPLDAKALGEAWERQKRMAKPSGALGMLEIISAQLSGLARRCPPPVPEPAAVALFAGDHGVHAQQVTPWSQRVTAQMVGNFLNGGAVCNAFAHQVGAEVCVVDVGVADQLPSLPGLLPRKVRPGTADFSITPAMTRDEALRAVEVGIETARDLVAAGNRALLTGEMGVANTTVSAALVSVYTGADPAEVTGRGAGVSDETHSQKIEVVRRALELHQADPADPLGVLAALGGLEHAALVGLILGGASLRTPVILDGVTAGAAALVARAFAPEALAACIAGHRSPEPGHHAALASLGLRPLIDLDLRLGEGTGALLALPVVQSAARAMHDVATFDAAGVTEKS